MNSQQQCHNIISCGQVGFVARLYLQETALKTMDHFHNDTKSTSTPQLLKHIAYILNSTHVMRHAERGFHTAANNNNKHKCPKTRFRVTNEAVLSEDVSSDHVYIR